MEKGDDLPQFTHLIAANDNDTPTSAETDAALTVIARAIGRQLAREAVREILAANDNDADDP